MEIKRQLTNLSRKEYFWIFILTLAVLGMHFSILYFPNDIILDEVYYVNDARSIINGTPTLRGEHPPLGGMLITFGMLLFGDNPLGWRFFVIIMGSASIFLLYLICRRLAMSRKASFIASFLLALENMTFIQSSVAMLDVFSVFFMLLAFWLYLKGNYPLASIAGCLGVLSKLTGVFIFIIIIIHWLIARRDRRSFFVLSIILAPLLFVELLALCDFAITRQLINPFLHLYIMALMNKSVTFSYGTHPYIIHPWEWITSLKVMPFHYRPDYLSVISPNLWVLIIPTVGYMAYKIKKGSESALFGIIWFASTYLLWILLDLLTNRVTYIFYFFPVVGSICIGLGIALSELHDFWRQRTQGKLRWLAVASFYFYLLLHLAVFVMLSPVFYRWIPAVRHILLPK